MTRQEFFTDYQRLCARFKLEPSDEQAKVWFERFGTVEAVVWTQAVDALVAEMRPPFLDRVLRAVDEARESRRHAAQAKAKRDANQYLTGVIPLRKYADPREGEYNDFRMRLLVQSVSQWGQAQTAQVHAEALDAWLQDDVHVDWASKQPMGACGLHTNATAKKHTLLACLVDEQRYWAARVDGISEREARRMYGEA